MMILTCPQCATRFFVEADEIGAAGRAVVCDECGAGWTAHPVTEETPRAEADFAGASSAPLFVRPADRPKPRRARRGGAAAILVLLLLLAAALLVFQRGVVRAWPGAARIYQSLGLAGADASRQPRG